MRATRSQGSFHLFQGRNCDEVQGRGGSPPYFSPKSRRHFGIQDLERGDGRRWSSQSTKSLHSTENCVDWTKPSSGICNRLPPMTVSSAWGGWTSLGRSSSMSKKRSFNDPEQKSMKLAFIITWRRVIDGGCQQPHFFGLHYDTQEPRTLRNPNQLWICKMTPRQLENDVGSLRQSERVRGPLNLLSVNRLRLTTSNGPSLIHPKISILRFYSELDKS